MFGLSHHKAVDQLNNLDKGIQLVVLHPNYRYHHLLFDEVLKERNSVYIRFSGSELTQSQLQGQLDEAFEAQGVRSGFKGLRAIVLDECDRATADELEAFLSVLVGQLKDGRVYVSSRVPPTFALTNEALRQRTCFIPTDENMMLWDYAQRDRQKQILLEVRALGTGRVLLNGQEISEWDGLLPRSLFFYLIDKGMTRRDDIFATFWPNLSVREATNVFHVTKRKISEVLGVDLTNYWGGFYRISNDIELSYDVVQFSEMVQGSALAAVEVEAELLRSAVWMYRDHFLTSVEMPWVADRRYELLQTYGEALIGLAKSLEKRDAKQEALGYYLRASATTPRREDIALSTMQLYRELDMPEDALKVYERLKDELARTVNVSPNKNVQELAEEIRRVVAGVR